MTRRSLVLVLCSVLLAAAALLVLQRRDPPATLPAEGQAVPAGSAAGPEAAAPASAEEKAPTRHPAAEAPTDPCSAPPKKEEGPKSLLSSEPDDSCSPDSAPSLLSR